MSRELLSDKSHFWIGMCEPERLIIVFSTAYNNFDISFLVLHAIFLQYGYSILYLKNLDGGMFADGCPGFGTSIDTMQRGLEAFINSHGIVETFVTGFSSGGYASLYLAGQIGASPYLGFGIKTDWSRTSIKKTSLGRVSPSLQDHENKTLTDLVSFLPMSKNWKGKADLWEA
jgi:hypothetical protein